MATRILLSIGLLMVCSCKGQTQDATADYVYKKGNPNGIGKWYKGREIAHVMGFQGMSWLERSEREEEENTFKLLQNMNIKPGDTLADIGAGSGYHVFKIAPIVVDGLVYAVDIQPEMLAAMEAKKEEGNSKNVILVQGSEKSVNLPENSVDKVLLVDVYHEFNYPREMIQSIKKAMRSNAELYLIEYRGEDASVPIKELHKMTEAQAVKEMKDAGLFLKRNISNLPWQHCMVFVKE
ncbi:class I SAM-dependent methyltransferase [Maribacter sp. PR1]|uniref:Class I SAM-dependent methyltransferase n=1 Tax=Maribacter cobaltidurans TaxID=1178778 RepID=A0ABU7ISV7_9FLAO|nr:MULTISPECIES: class I SAM-dependent methyltransferase [Maribacter]MDC6388477.1 class I SAM-dependent methyltransferase [Maribacter sp. PR1]MEE1975866.1 class I SAM-dependent methyltransferase [Maribacter cobaltidurans]